MPNRNALFIVEGNSDEPKFIRRLFEKCYAKQEYKTYVYKTNLHILAKRLEEDYPDFDEDEIDIRLVLRSYEESNNQRDVLSANYTDIYLIFDFEPQHDSPHFKTIGRMLNYFYDSSLRGKLFINYPMMQSYRHFSRLPEPLFYDVKAASDEWKRYKRIVGEVSAYKDISKYDYRIFVSLAVHHLKKANYIFNGIYELPSIDEYLLWNLKDIFEKQVIYKDRDSFVYVLNTCIFILIDYQPDSFFRKIKNQGKQFLI